MNAEYDRLKAVKRFANLDAGLNKDLHEIVDLIAQYADMPIALISLIDETMQWFKASVGMGDMVCHERSQTFCTRTIEQKEVLIVRDAIEDERFAHLDVVVGEPHVRFYAGVPLITYDGYAIGSVCIVDTKPRELTALQINLLKALSKQVLNLIELNWSLHTLSEQNLETLKQKKLIEDSELKLRAIFNSSKDLHLLIGKQNEILAYNKATEIYVKKYHQKQIRRGAYILNFLTGAHHGEFLEHTQNALKGNHNTVEWLFEPGQPNERWLEITFTPVTDKHDCIMGVSVDTVDVTQRKQSEQHIEQQNAAILRISTIQSTQLRRPIASLLGLVEVMKLEGIECGTYLDMIEQTVNELDHKVNHIIEDAEATIEHG